MGAGAVGVVKIWLQPVKSLMVLGEGGVEEKVVVFRKFSAINGVESSEWGDAWFCLDHWDNCRYSVLIIDIFVAFESEIHLSVTGAECWEGEFIGYQVIPGARQVVARPDDIGVIRRAVGMVDRADLDSKAKGGVNN